MFTVTGLLSVAFGAIVAGRPVAGALTIALLFGLFSIASGVTAIMQGDQLRRTGTALHAVTIRSDRCRRSHESQRKANRRTTSQSVHGGCPYG